MLGFRGQNSEVLCGQPTCAAMRPRESRTPVSFPADERQNHTRAVRIAHFVFEPTFVLKPFPLMMPEE